MKFSRVFSWLGKKIAGFLFFLFVRIMYLALRGRPIKTRFRACKIVARIIYWLYKPGRERIKRNISLIRPDLYSFQVAEDSLQVAETLAHSWAAMLGNERTSLAEVAAKLDVTGIDPLLDCYHRGEKIITTAVHNGPVDEMIGIVPIFDLQVYIPAELGEPKWFFELMKRLRLHFKGIIFDPVEKGKILDRAAHYLSDGVIVVLMIDVPRKDESGVVCRIGNAKARFSVGAVKLALEQKATIFPVFPSWGEDWRVKVAIGSPFELIRTGDHKYDIEINTRRLIEEVYAPHIQKNYYSWLRALWSDLEEVENCNS